MPARRSISRIGWTFGLEHSFEIGRIRRGFEFALAVRGLHPFRHRDADQTQHQLQLPERRQRQSKVTSRLTHSRSRPARVTLPTQQPGVDFLQRGIERRRRQIRPSVGRRPALDGLHLAATGIHLGSVAELNADQLEPGRLVRRRLDIELPFARGMC
jgi:hypothetical protein